MNHPAKVKCPTCDYSTEPFYMKINQCPNKPEPEAKPKYNCSICKKKNDRKSFQARSQEGYHELVALKHPRKSNVSESDTLEPSG